jgi:hypothetical protein
MRRLFAEVIALTFVTLSGGAAEGQIQLVPGPQTPVSASPTYITKGDFYGHNDGIDDVAVTNGRSQITTLKGQAGSTIFGAARPFNVGSVLQGLAAGNFNGRECVGGTNPQVDCNSDPNICNGGVCKPVTDIAVADKRRARVFWPFGNDDGNLRSTGNVSMVLRSAIDVAVGNFDGPDPQKKDDLAVVNNGLAKISVLLNQGTGFQPQSTIDYAVGQNPKRIITAQLDDDVFDDIVTVDTGTAAADSVSVLLSSKSYDKGGYTVGPKAVDVAAGNLGSHPDNAHKDLVVLNQGNLNTAFSVSILINDGTGQFNAKPGVTVNCPPTIGGIPIFCQPNFIALGDLDGDGFADLAITVRTQAQVTNAAVSAGLVIALKGNGQGGFVFGDQVTVGLNPKGIVAGNFTGRSDGIQDLAIAEYGTKSVRIVKPVPPPPLGPGVTCNKPEQCMTGLFCVNNACCDTGTGTASCPDDLRCDIPGKAGTCQAPGVPGDRCTDPGQCAPPSGSTKGICVDGFCCMTTCDEPLVCNTGTCGPPSGDPGTPCNSTNEFGGNNQCAEPLYCVDDVCCQGLTLGERCPVGQSCNVPGSEGMCTSKLPLGSPCTDPSQCAPPTSTGDTGYCVENVCCEQASCPGGTCALPSNPGFCEAVPATSTPTPPPTSTPTPQPTGRPCSDPAQCVSNSCVDSVCCITDPPGMSQCQPTSTGNPQFCNISDSLGTCAPQKNIGEPCAIDTDCVTGNCDKSVNACGAVRTATPTVTPTPTSPPTLTPTPKPGDPCSGDNQCPANFVCNSNEHVCCETRTCATGLSCAVASNPGFCTLLPTPTMTTTPLAGPGEPCTSPDGCVSGFCTDGVCCDQGSADGTCPVSEQGQAQRCDITGSEGVCSPQGDQGAPCSKNTDCNALLQCDRTSGTCQIPSDTPTPGPSPTGNPTAVIQAFTSSGGGCSISNRAERSAAWLLAAVPLLLGMRRYRLHGARVSRIHSARE